MYPTEHDITFLAMLVSSVSALDVITRSTAQTLANCLCECHAKAGEKNNHSAHMEKYSFSGGNVCETCTRNIGKMLPHITNLVLFFVLDV